MNVETLHEPVEQPRDGLYLFREMCSCASTLQLLAEHHPAVVPTLRQQLRQVIQRLDEAIDVLVELREGEGAWSGK